MAETKQTGRPMACRALFLGSVGYDWIESKSAKLYPGESRPRSLQGSGPV